MRSQALVLNGRTRVTNRQPLGMDHSWLMLHGTEGARAPNLGPIWAQRPRLGITQCCLIGGGYFIRARFRPTYTSALIWGSRSLSSNLASLTCLA